LPRGRRCTASGSGEGTKDVGQPQMRIPAVVAAWGVAVLMGSPAAGAQTFAPPQLEAVASSREAIAPSQDPPSQDDESAVRKLLRDEWDAYKNFFSWDNAIWLGGGGAVSLGPHPLDQDVHEAALDAGTPTLWGG